MKVSTFIKKVRKLGLRLGFMKFIGYEAIFSCAFRPSGCREWIALPHTDDFWYADPLIYARDGRQIVFMERVNRHTGIGSIVASDITEGRWTAEIPVIEEPFHMSFPMIFEWDGELYMIPETEMNDAVNLYRCIEFPYKWAHAARLLEGTKLVDSVVTGITSERVDLIASEYLPEDDFYTRFRRYAIRKNSEGQIEAVDIGIVAEKYTLQSRMAGYPMTEDGRHIPDMGEYTVDGKAATPPEKTGSTVYPVQRSTSGVYGYSVMFMEDDPCNGRTLRELLPDSVRDDGIRMYDVKGKIPRLIGVHTYSRTEHVEVIDIQYLAKKIHDRIS